MSEIGPQEVHNINVSLPGLRAMYFGELQNLLDIVRFVHTGQDLVTKEAYDKKISARTFDPSASRKLTYESTRALADKWLLRGFFTQAVDATGVFLDQCRRMCALLNVLSQDEVTTAQLNHVFGKGQDRFHRLTFPDKFKHLKQKYSVVSGMQDPFLSLNSARNCLVHRNGVVGGRDVDTDQHLTIRWLSMQLLIGADGGAKRVLQVENGHINKGDGLSIGFVEQQRRFPIGDTISFEAQEVSQVLLTLYEFGRQMVKQIREYGKRIDALSEQKKLRVVSDD